MKLFTSKTGVSVSPNFEKQSPVVTQPFFRPLLILLYLLYLFFLCISIMKWIPALSRWWGLSSLYHFFWKPFSSKQQPLLKASVEKMYIFLFMYSLFPFISLMTPTSIQWLFGVVGMVVFGSLVLIFGGMSLFHVFHTRGPKQIEGASLLTVLSLFFLTIGVQGFFHLFVNITSSPSFLNSLTVKLPQCIPPFVQRLSKGTSTWKLNIKDKKTGTVLLTSKDFSLEQIPSEWSIDITTIVPSSDPGSSTTNAYSSWGGNNGYGGYGTKKNSSIKQLWSSLKKNVLSGNAKGPVSTTTTLPFTLTVATRSDSTTQKVQDITYQIRQQVI